MAGPLVSIRIRGFRSARDVTLEPGPITALVGEPGSGKSNLLAAIWKLLAFGSAPFEPADLTAAPLQIDATLGSRKRMRLEIAPGRGEERRSGTPPDALFLPASRRADALVPAESDVPPVIQQALDASSSGALALVRAVELLIEAGTTDLVLMIEEPELFLRPQAQRHLYRLLRELAGLRNQVIYSTHAATFLNVSRLEELALVERDPSGATHIRRPKPLPEAETFRALSEFDADRSELLLARAALLVEGRTEKLVFPFLFRALGYDADSEGISIVECGGKPNIPVIAAVCNAVGVPYLVVHDRDADAGRRPIASERTVNQAIARVAGAKRTIVLTRDFEAVAQLHGHRHKPGRAQQWFALADSPGDVPKQLAAAVTRVVALARNDGRRT
jgi:predicted ATP-dependent endonuclease of OLD family